jgi:DNA-binding MarR family transcriptional regulator
MTTKKDRQKLEEAKQRTVLHTLLKCARLINEQAMARVNKAAGKTVMRPAIASLFPHISLEGTRPGEVARRAGMTKQQAGQLLAELEEQGVVETFPDPNDGRARLVRFTRFGLEAIQHGMSIFQGIEAELERKIGTIQFQALRSALPTLLTALEGDES